MQEPVGPLDEASFSAVLTAARDGAPWAAEALFIDLQPRLLRFLRSAEPRAADDLAGEVWLAIARGIATFVGELPDFRGWVFSIARRRLADHRRTAARRATDPVDHSRLADRRDGADTAGQALDRMSGQAAVDLITASLPAEQAEVLVLRIVAELDVARVAEVMGRSANWVRVTQHRALRRLEERFEGDRERIFQDPVIPTTAPTICSS
ncbi:MAG: sigma-70 family RNA polymerase sigma factor [Actinomycetota bacterium]|nr:sigma-70 family RNA polymerase sigma factor [Actinomycetota bacterium]